MASAYMSSHNVAYLLQICGQFLQERFQLQLVPEQLQSALQQSMRELLAHYRESPPLPSIEELNKRTIIRVKEKAMIIAREPPKQAKAARAAAPPPPAPAAEKDVAPEVPIMETMQSNEGGAEEFITKLQELELQRSAQIMPDKTAPPPPSPVVAPPPVAPPPQGAPTILYVPTVTAPAKQARTILIQSAERMWDYFHERNAFVWAGPTPDAALSVAAAVLPACVASMMPVVVVRIQGVGGQAVEVHCTCETRGAAWDVWRPASRAAAVVPAIACPWNITLVGADLGSDGFVVEAAELLPRGTTRLRVPADAGVKAGTRLLCKTRAGETRTLPVLLASDGALEVAGDRRDCEGGICAVADMQSSLILEVTKNDVATTTPK
jgi:hypothetical protein